MRHPLFRPGFILRHYGGQGGAASLVGKSFATVSARLSRDRETFPACAVRLSRDRETFPHTNEQLAISNEQ
jgi:hypothetical protein